MVARRCQYVVQPTDPSVNELAAGYGVDVAQIDALNPPGYWAPGNTVVLPYAMCRALEGAVPGRPNLCVPGSVWDPTLGRCVPIAQSPVLVPVAPVPGPVVPAPLVIPPSSSMVTVAGLAGAPSNGSASGMYSMFREEE